MQRRTGSDDNGDVSRLPEVQWNCTRCEIHNISYAFLPNYFVYLRVFRQQSAKPTNYRCSYFYSNIYIYILCTECVVLRHTHTIAIVAFYPSVYKFFFQLLRRTCYSDLTVCDICIILQCTSIFCNCHRNIMSAII